MPLRLIQPLRVVCLLLLAIPLISQDTSFEQPALQRMAGGTGLAGKDASIFYINPSLLSNLGAGGATLTASTELRFGLADLTASSVNVALGTASGGWGLRASALSATRDYTATEVSIAHGRQLSQTLSVGGRLGGGWMALANTTTSLRTTLQIGARLEVSQRLTAGASITVRTFGTDESPRRRRTEVSLGGGYHPADNLSFLFELHWGGSRLPGARCGMVYLPGKAVELRAGVATDTREVSLGVGYHVRDRLWIHFGAVRHDWLGVSPMTHLRYSLGGGS